MAAAPFGSTRGLVARKKSPKRNPEPRLRRRSPYEKLARSTLEQAWLHKSGAALSSFLQPFSQGLGFGAQ